MWMLYCFTGPSLDCQQEAGCELGGWGGVSWGGGGGLLCVYVCVLTGTFCDDIQLDDWCGTEDRDRRANEKKKLKES